MTGAEIVRVALQRHEAWLRSDGRDGERFVAARFGSGEPRALSDLNRANLVRADLRSADLRGCDLAEADLREADLTSADLSGATLEGADLAGADLRGCRLANCRMVGVRSFRRASLRDADLQGVTGLTGPELAGADLAGARLPDGLSFSARLDYVAETSQNARPAFISILLSCVFIVLTVYSTPDAALLSNASLALLPDLATDIPAASFFWIAPILLLALYIYLHLQMSGIGETLAELPAVFTDGTPVGKRAYPWLATDLLRLQQGWRGVRFEEALIIALLWASVPLTLVAIWLRYLPLRSWWVSGLHVALIVACVWGAMRMFEQTAAALSAGAIRVPLRRPLLAGLAVVLTGLTPLIGTAPLLFDVNPRRATRLVLDLRDADLPGADLRGRDIRYAAGSRADLAGADLRDADLRRADFQRAVFAAADLEDADLRGTDLDAADFRNACLRKARLDDADMEDADFSGAYLGRASMRSPLLVRAAFVGANLQGADFRGADLRRADFTDAVLGCAIAHKKDLHPEVICADLEGAVLTGARFPGADLQSTRGLTQSQMDESCGDEATRLPDGLQIPICPEATPVRAATGTPSAENPCLHEMRDDRWPQ